MKLIFGAAPTPGSLLIRGLTFSRWSHVGIVFGDEVIEAHWPRVASRSLDEFKAHYPSWDVTSLPCANEAAAERFVREQLGKLYDLGGLIAIPFQQRDWQAPSRWFCSELPPAAAAIGGTPYFLDAEQHRVTPGQLYAITRKD